MTRPRHWRSSSTARVEPLVEALDEREDRGGFGLEHLARERAVSHRSAAPRPASTIASMRDQPPQQRLEQVEAQRVLRVALRARRVLVHFEEDAVHAGRDAGRRQRLDVLAPGRP